MYKTYVVAMNRYFSIHGKTSAFADELREFVNEPSLDEFIDVIHSVVSHYSLLLAYVLAHRTAIKHVQRYIEYGCIRSKRNSCGKCKEVI